MNTILLRVNRLLYRLAGAALLYSIAYGILLWALGYGNNVINFWLAFRADYATPYVCVLILIVIVGAVFVKLFTGQYRSSADKSISATLNWTVGLLLGTGVILYAADFIRFWQTGMTYIELVQDVRLSSHTYHLVLRDYDPAEGYNAIYILYECDRLDFLCTTVRSLSRGNGITPDVEQIALIPHPDANSISLEINSEIVETYS
jgi:hypothetical protein